MGDGWEMLYVRIPPAWKTEIQIRANGDGGISGWVRAAIAEHLQVLPPASMDDILNTYNEIHDDLNDRIRKSDPDDIHDLVDWLQEEVRTTTRRDPTSEQVELFILRRYARIGSRD